MWVAVLIHRQSLTLVQKHTRRAHHGVGGISPMHRYRFGYDFLHNYTIVCCAVLLHLYLPVKPLF